MNTGRWVVTTARAADGGPTIPAAVRELALGRSLLVGREGDVPVGVEVEDLGVSRRAALIAAVDDGWDIRVVNRNGAVLHPWGQAAVLARPREMVCWPRVALRIRGSDDAVEHWVLLESDDLPLLPGGPARPTTGTLTARSRASDPLTPAQLQAIHTVFAEQLSWPPTAAAQALQLKQAATRLGLSETGVKDRLSKARRRAEQLGLRPGESTTDPEYLFALVRAGLVPIPGRLSAERHCSTAVCAPSLVPAVISDVPNVD